VCHKLFGLPTGPPVGGDTESAFYVESWSHGRDQRKAVLSLESRRTRCDTERLHRRDRKFDGRESVDPLSQFAARSRRDGTSARIATACDSARFTSRGD